MELPALVAIIAGTAILAGLVAFGLGRRRHGEVKESTRLEEYPFYPFVANESGQVEFSASKFQEAVSHFMMRRNPLAAGELIVIGEQNFVRDTFGTEDLQRYKRFFDAYEGQAILNDNNAFLENYKRIVHLLGRSFPNTGIEILLHNLVNPTKSIVAIENGDVTGRSLEMGTTNLVLDLKTRRHQNQDKLNYELSIGARRFKCTTIPIFRAEYGLVGAICVNIDERFLREEVMRDPERLQAFFDNILKVDMTLDENILSRDEYSSALRGKRHYLDEAIRSGTGSMRETQLAAIVFSDIAAYTTIMKRDEALALRIREASSNIHRRLIARFGGRLLKEMGDGFLASFASVTRAVDCAREIQRAVREDGRFEVRIGIHLGEVVQTEGDVFGDGVNLASRIHGEAAPGSIAVSAVVYDNVRNKEEIVAADLGERTLKNVDEPVRVYTIEV
jgi:class 3 adenylate cyclase